ncbi:hypothetical protein B0H10DRAFT_1938501 [Mycena sp. CBHHK59/15]|nr:hypothetical protein B0H10DRAFT_1938501 [Mycena sp. CBHHK59/15]
MAECCCASTSSATVPPRPNAGPTAAQSRSHPTTPRPRRRERERVRGWCAWYLSRNQREPSWRDRHRREGDEGYDGECEDEDSDGRPPSGACTTDPSSACSSTPGCSTNFDVGAVDADAKDPARLMSVPPGEYARSEIATGASAHGGSAGGGRRALALGEGAGSGEVEVEVEGEGEEGKECHMVDEDEDNAGSAWGRSPYVERDARAGRGGRRRCADGGRRGEEKEEGGDAQRR